MEWTIILLKEILKFISLRKQDSTYFDFSVKQVDNLFICPNYEEDFKI